MLNPIGGLGVCCTIAEKENSISKPWLWTAQKQPSKAISKKSEELSGLRRPAPIQKKIVWYNYFFFFVGTVNLPWSITIHKLKKFWYNFSRGVIPNCERTSLLKEPFCSKVLEIKLNWRMYNSAKCASHRRIKHWRILLLMLWLKRYIKKNITETQVRT